MIVELLHKIAAAEVAEKGPRKYFPRPSIAGPERCIRQMVYWGRDYEKKPLPGRAAMIFDDSSWHEELSADWIRKTAYKLHSTQMHVNIPAGLEFLPKRVCKFIINEKECGQEIAAGNIAGHIDGILLDMLGKDVKWEHKAIQHFTFREYVKGSRFPLDNITQVATYLKGVLLLQPELTDALLLIKNKMTAQYLEYYIVYDPQSDTATIIYMMDSIDKKKIELNKEFLNITQNAFDKFALVQQLIDKQEIPPRQYERSDWQCQYCPYGELCWEGWQDEIKQMETDVVLAEEFGTLLGHRQELSMHINEMTKEKKLLDKDIKAKLKEKGVRQGTVDKYTVELKVINKKEYTAPATSYEQVNIRLRKEAKCK